MAQLITYMLKSRVTHSYLASSTLWSSPTMTFPTLFTTIWPSRSTPMPAQVASSRT
jgi:hypothetical protein